MNCKLAKEELKERAGNQNVPNSASIFRTYAVFPPEWIKNTFLSPATLPTPFLRSSGQPESSKHGVGALAAWSQPSNPTFGPVKRFRAFGRHWRTGRHCWEHQSRYFGKSICLSGGFACVSQSPGWLSQRGGLLGSSACPGEIFLLHLAFLATLVALHLTPVSK